MSKTLCILLASLSPFLAYAEEAKPAEKELDLGKISESFGHLIGKNLENLDIEFDMQRVVQGLQDSLAGKVAPLSETECVQAISLIQESTFKKLSETNLKAAEAFLVKNAKEKGVSQIEVGKLQYKIETVGTGTVVGANDSPLIRYTGKFLDGQVFGQSKEDEMISLNETIAGFSKGIVGMKEGEKRTLYIHPELGYGTNGYLPPNSLLTFEIEVVKANAPKVIEAPVENDEVAAVK